MLKKMNKPRICKEYLEELERAKCYKHIAFDDENRLLHSRGHSVQEIFQLRYGHFNRYVDVVIYPDCHDHVEKIVQLAVKYSKQVMIIPYGGGTTVTQSLLVPEDETRMVISVDTHEMNRVLWVDKKNMMACLQAGVTGMEAYELLEKFGVTLGHEPDSYELSTMGGWVATRASGMKKNKYGNVEDFLLDAKVVTPMGTFHQGAHERKSTGPDLKHLFLGSEGTLGIVTECIVRVHDVPKYKRYGSIVFPTFLDGVNCLNDVYKAGINPACIRLVDNVNFSMGSSLKEKLTGVANAKRVVVDAMKKTLLTKVKGFNIHEICAATFLIEENDLEVVNKKQQQILDIAKKYSGLDGGEEPGRQGFLLTYVIAYLRDFAFQYHFMCESFESNVPWDKVDQCQKKVRERIIADCKKVGVSQQPWVCSRVSQCYQTGVCLYFYFGIVFSDIKDPVAAFSKIEEGARDEILSLGGSLSHHHGVGKLRRKWMPEGNPQVITKSGFEMLKTIKNAIDKDNIFGNGNLNLTEAKISVVGHS